jgi:hypothetical protein
LFTYGKFDEGSIGISGLGTHDHPPCSPDLVPSDFYLLYMKVHLGQTFQTDKHEHIVRNWLDSQDETFYAAGIINLRGQGEKYVSIKGECLEEE